MGKKTTEVKNTIGAKDPAQKRFQELMLANAEKASSQMGDLSGLAAGGVEQLSPEMLALLEQAQGAARLNIENQYTQGLRDQRSEASSRGIGGSTIDAIGQAILGQGKATSLAGLESDLARSKIDLPMQLAQLKLQTNSLLQNMFSGNAAPALGAYSQERMARGTQTQTTSGATIGELASAAGSFMPKKN